MEVTNFSPIIPQPYPWLIICDGKDQERQTLVNISDNHFKSMTIPEMRNKSICTSTKEWLVLKDLDSMDLCLLNLTSKEVVQLPRLESTIRTDICILSSPESESIHDCHVMFIDGLTFYFCQPGDKKFSEQVFEFDLEGRLVWIPTATMFRGKVYFLTIISEGPNELFTAEFVNSSLHFTKFTSKNVPMPLHPEIVDYLVESSGELLFIEKMRGGWNFNKILGFSIFRMDFSSQMWVQQNNIRGQTIFLSQPYGLKHNAISCFAREEGIRKNSIYFTKCSDRYIYIFDLEDHSISKSLSCPIVSKHNSRLDWVMIP
ncbi:uncharacterized protein LOC136069932 [Quercus suber]|uniref:uncharacterized protein LOC136069932 n=1 Tax=Quercus suber TaxID=58331 RepID=UPI0032DFD2DA